MSARSVLETGRNSNQKLRCLQNQYQNMAVFFSSSKRLPLSTEPVRQIADSLNFQLLPQSLNCRHQFQELKADEYKVVWICSPRNMHSLPTRPKRKCNFIQELKLHGLTPKCALLTYVYGNYIGNLHFIWKVCDNDDVMTLSQQTIQKAKSIFCLVSKYCWSIVTIWVIFSKLTCLYHIQFPFSIVHDWFVAKIVV